MIVWEDISMQGKTDLYILPQGSTTAFRYRDEILDVDVRSHAGAVGEDFIFMDDNAPPHRARIITDCMQREIL